MALTVTAGGRGCGRWVVVWAWGGESGGSGASNGCKCQVR